MIRRKERAARLGLLGRAVLQAQGIPAGAERNERAVRVLRTAFQSPVFTHGQSARRGVHERHGQRRRVAHLRLRQSHAGRAALVSSRQNESERD